MAKRRRRSGLQQLKLTLGMVTSARNLSKAALLQLRKEISATRSRLENLVGEERSFKLDLFGTGGPGRPRTVSGSRKAGRPAGRRATARKAKPRRKGPPKADKSWQSCLVSSPLTTFGRLPGRRRRSVWRSGRERSG